MANSKSSKKKKIIIIIIMQQLENKNKKNVTKCLEMLLKEVKL